MPRRACTDWASVLSHARKIVDAVIETPTRPELFAMLVQAGHCTENQNNAFRSALRTAQRRYGFPQLPSARTGPAPQTPWNEARYEAEERRGGKPTEAAYFFDLERSCAEHLATTLATSSTVPLDGRTLAQLREAGWGEAVVLRSVQALRLSGRAQVRAAFDHLTITTTMEE